MKTSKFTDSQIMSILKQAESGTPVAALCREHDMSNATFYKWRAKYGGMDTSLMARLRELEAEKYRPKPQSVFSSVSSMSCCAMSALSSLCLD